MRGISKAAIAAMAIGLAGLSARADNRDDGSLNDGECSPVRAQIVTDFFVDGCDSIFGICTQGTIASGPLAGTTRFSVTSIDVSSPAFTGYTGVLVITAAQGTVTIFDKGALSNLDGTFFEIDPIVSGTDFFANATGTLFSSGHSTATGFDGFIYGQYCVAPPNNQGSN